MPQQCAEPNCVFQTDSGICKQCSAEQQYGSPRDYDADGRRVDRPDAESTDDGNEAVDVVSDPMETLEEGGN